MIVSEKMKQYAVEEMKLYHSLRLSKREKFVTYPNFVLSPDFKKIETEYLPGMEYFYKFNFEDPDDLKYTKFFFDYPELKERVALFKRRLEIGLDRNLDLDFCNTLYLIFVCYAYTFNKQTLSLEEIISPYPITKFIKHPKISFMCHNFEASTCYKMVYGTIASLLDSGLAVSVEQILDAFKIKNTSFFTTIDNILYNHSLWFHDLYAPQEHTKTLREAGIYKDEDIDRLVLQATPTVTYEFNSKVPHTFSPQFLLINSYFNYPRYTSLKVPMSILDVYGFSQDQENLLVNFINYSQPGTLAVYFTYLAMYVNFNDITCLASAQKNAYRLLLPLQHRITADKWKLIEKLCKRDFVQDFTLADYAQCKAGVKHLLVSDELGLKIKDIEAKQAPKKLRRDAMNELERFGEYATLCQRRGIQPSADDFKRWVESN